MYLYSNITFVQLLKQHVGQDITGILNEFGVTNWKHRAQPFRKLYEEEVTALLFRWTLEKLRIGVHIKLRIRDEDGSTVYDIILRKNKSEIILDKIQKKRLLRMVCCMIGN